MLDKLFHAISYDDPRYWAVCRLVRVWLRRQLTHDEFSRRFRWLIADDVRERYDWTDSHE